MNLKELKAHFEAQPEGTGYEVGLSKPFSWRGIYAEVAFAILEQPMTREEILANIGLAYADTFCGYKGGEFTYRDGTPVHFEEDYGRWTDGDYAAQWISKIEGREPYQDQETRLIKLAFE